MCIDSIDPKWLQAVATSLSAIAAICAAAAAVFNFRLAKSIQNDAKADELLVLGEISHPELKTRQHTLSVVQISIFNKSKRKAYISGITFSGQDGKPIEVKWSDEIDDCGNPVGRSNRIGIVDTVTIYARPIDGRDVDYARIEISHSFPKSPEVIVFDPYAEFVDAFVSDRSKS